MGLWNNIGTDERNDWNSYTSKLKAINWSNKQSFGDQWKNAGKFFDATGSAVLQMGSAPLIEGFQSLGSTIANGSDVGGKKNENTNQTQNNAGAPGDGGGHNSFNMYGEQAVGTYDQYSNYYTNAHDSTLIHPPDDNVTLYKFNSIPITTNGTNVFGHMTTADTHLTN